jgi:hypothetical protein
MFGGVIESGKWGLPWLCVGCAYTKKRGTLAFTPDLLSLPHNFAQLFGIM